MGFINQIEYYIGPAKLNVVFYQRYEPRIFMKFGSVIQFLVLLRITMLGMS